MNTEMKAQEEAVPRWRRKREVEKGTLQQVNPSFELKA